MICCACKPPFISFYTNSILSVSSERDVQDSLINPQEGRKFASVTRLEDVGHLVCTSIETR